MSNCENEFGKRGYIDKNELKFKMKKNYNENF